MSEGKQDAAGWLDRLLERAATNLSVEKLIVQVGLDPNNITLQSILDRLVEITLANITIINMLALLGALFYVITLMVRTIVPLRVIGIVSMVFFIAYGALAGALATFLLYLLSLPINIVRLYQMLNLVKKARISARGDLSIEWLKPFMTQKKFRKGNILFRKNDPANEMFYIITGKFLVTEIDIELVPGSVMGELGFLTQNNRRTQTVECTEDGNVLGITYDKLLELYFQNQEFGYYFLRLASERLLQNIARLELLVETYKNESKKDVRTG